MNLRAISGDDGQLAGIRGFEVDERGIAAHRADALQIGIRVDHLGGDGRLVHDEEVVRPFRIGHQHVDRDLAVGVRVDGHVGHFAHHVEGHFGDRLDDEDFRFHATAPRFMCDYLPCRLADAAVHRALHQ